MGELDLSLVGLAGEGERVEFSGSLPLRVDAARGVVYGERGGGGRGNWSLHISAPITSLWIQDGLQLSRINLSSHSILPSDQRPSLMMGEPASLMHVFILIIHACNIINNPFFDKKELPCMYIYTYTCIDV